MQLTFQKSFCTRWQKRAICFTSDFSSQKRNGLFREISQPAESLKAVQAWVLRRVIGSLRVSPACNGFERGRSILDNALPHVLSNAIMCLDIEAFFPSVAANRVYRVFRTIGYGTTASGLLTGLCTLNGGLPQGALVLSEISESLLPEDGRALRGFCGPRGIVYTRYADDLTFSAMQAETLVGAMRVIKSIVEDERFALNDAKQRIMGPARQRRVTGVVLGDDAAGIGRQRYRELRSTIHRLLNIPAHEADVGELNRIKGSIAYTKGIDRKRWRMLVAYIEKLHEGHGGTAITNLRSRIIPRTNDRPVLSVRTG